MFYLPVAFVLLAFSFEPVLANETISTRSFVIFNTRCANCHEGECSSRMCFQMGAGEAAVHIRNYAGEVSDNTVEELYRALRHMKGNCAYCSSPAKIPRDGKWSKDDIRLLSLSSRQAIFIPLGKLKTARYALQFSFEKPVSFRLEILSQHFEPLIDERFSKSNRKVRLSFRVDRISDHYLRIRSRFPLSLNSLELKVVGERK